MTNSTSQPASLRRPRWWEGALVGVASAGAGFAAAELVVATSRELRSPVASIGDRFIDVVPLWLKDVAVGWFGTNHKLALIVGIVTVVGIVAAVAGAVLHARRLRGWMVATAALLGLVGIASSLRSPGAQWWAAMPSAAAAATAGTALVGLSSLGWKKRGAVHAEQVARSQGELEAITARAGMLDRRRLVVGALAVSCVAAVAGSVGLRFQRRFSNMVDRLAVVVPSAARRRPERPPDPAGDLTGLSPLFTPNSLFYRVDTALVIPSVDLADWRLAVNGRVDRELSISYEELLAMPLVEADVTLACVSNEVGGPLVGNARWVGVQLSELLDLAGVRPEADQVMGHSVDGFSAGFPLSVVNEREAVVAVGMNGEVLPQRHGFPARLVVAGLFGYVSATKWLSEITLTRFDEAEGYWIPRGWARDGPVKTQSRVDRPRGGSVDAGPFTIAGVAWASALGIARVQVQVDDGPWRDATLGPSVGGDSWRQWWIDWTATPGSHRIRCRATDGTGYTQTEELSDLAPDGATGWHTRNVTVM